MTLPGNIQFRFRAAILLIPAWILWSADILSAEVRLPAIFGSRMVLQQGKPIPVWGWAARGESVTVSLAGQSRQTTGDDQGTWKVQLDPLAAGGPHTMSVRGANTITLEDVLIGEVWICSGQSNMEWPVRSSNDFELEAVTANYPGIRIITVPKVGTQDPQSDFKGEWQICTPETVADFSAVGFFFGRMLHQALKVPIGLVDNAWGGSAAEAWVRRDLMASDERYTQLLERWAETEKTFNLEKARAEYDRRLKQWEEDSAKAKTSGAAPPARPQGPANPLIGNARPGNIYNGMLRPILDYGMRGVIWYQGETNAPRAYQYRSLFPLLIQSWRDEWKQGDFPFYWVQLADFRDARSEPVDSDWAELREAQTMTLGLPNTGEAVIIDLGEAKDIHPRNKQVVAKRLARWALACDYGMKISYRSPTYRAMEKKGSRIVLSFDHVGGGLITFDVRQPLGFAIAGSDRKFVWAKAQVIEKDKVEVWSDEIADPAAVRYAWADNPVCNLLSREGLPATPFRTDDWPGITANTHR